MDGEPPEAINDQGVVKGVDLGVDHRRVQPAVCGVRLAVRRRERLGDEALVVRDACVGAAQIRVLSRLPRRSPLIGVVADARGLPAALGVLVVPEALGLALAP